MKDIAVIGLGDRRRVCLSGLGFESLLSASMLGAALARETRPDLQLTLLSCEEVISLNAKAHAASTAKRVAAEARQARKKANRERQVRLAREGQGGAS